MSPRIITEAVVDEVARHVRRSHGAGRYSGDEANAVLELLGEHRVGTRVPPRLGYVVQRAFATGRVDHVRAPYLFLPFSTRREICPFPAMLGWVIGYPGSAIHVPFLRDLLRGHYRETRPALIGCLDACAVALEVFFTANVLKREDVFERIQRFAVLLAQDELRRNRTPQNTISPASETGSSEPDFHS